MEEMMDDFMNLAVDMKKDCDELYHKFEGKPETYVYAVFCTFMDYYMHNACGYSAERRKEARAFLFNMMNVVNEEIPM